MITLTARLTIREGQEQAFEKAVAEIAPQVRAEEGNHAYVFHRASENPREVFVYEKYSDAAAIDAHRKHMKEIAGALGEVVEGPPKVEIWEEIPV